MKTFEPPAAVIDDVRLPELGRRELELGDALIQVLGDVLPLPDV